MNTNPELPNEPLQNLDIADVVEAYENWQKETAKISKQDDDEDDYFYHRALADEEYRFSCIYQNRHRILTRHIMDAKGLLWGVQRANDPDTDEQTWAPIVKNGLWFYIQGTRDNLAALEKSMKEIKEIRAKVPTDPYSRTYP